MPTDIRTVNVVYIDSACTHMYVHMYVHTYDTDDTCVHNSDTRSIKEHAYIYAYACTCMRIYVCYTLVRIHTYIRMYVHACMYVCIPTDTHHFACASLSSLSTTWWLRVEPLALEGSRASSTLMRCSSRSSSHLCWLRNVAIGHKFWARAIILFSSDTAASC